MQYDAFISYRHCPPDSAVAEALHKRLEHYHIPGAVRQLTGKKRFSRIFRDKEELPLSADLTGDIYEALDHSDYLILICSPESAASLWVQREVEYFVKQRGRERVLTVLLRGEPEKVFPDILCREDAAAAAGETDAAAPGDAADAASSAEVTAAETGDVSTSGETEKEDAASPAPERTVEPLAADIRGRSQRENLRKLKSEMLRLIAAMLGCPYDSLVRRHRAFRIRCALLAAASCAAVLCCFLLYNAYEQRQLESARRESRQLEAAYLSEASLDALEAGDRAGALSLALAASSEDETEPASPLQLYALNSALYSFKSGTWLEYAPEYSSEITDLADGSFSADGAYYYAVSESGEGYVLSGETGAVVRQIDTDLLEELLQEAMDSGRSDAGNDAAEYDANADTDTDAGAIPDAQTPAADEETYIYDTRADASCIQLIVPYEDHTALVLLQYAACIIDADTCEAVRIFPMSSSNVNLYSWDLDGDIFACCTYGSSADYCVFVYDLTSGSLLAELSVYEALGYTHELGDHMYLDRSALALDAAGGRLVLAASWLNEDPADAPGGLVLYDYAEDTLEILSDAQAETAVFLGDGRIAALHREQPAAGAASIEWSYYTYYPALYDASGGLLWTGENTTSLETVTAPVIRTGRFSDDEALECLIFSCGSRVVLTDCGSGAVCAMLDYDSDILNLEMTGEDSLIIGTADGWFQQVTLSGGMVIRSDLMRLSASPDGFVQAAGQNRICVLIEGTAVFCGNTADENMETFAVEEDSSARIESVDYYEVGERVLRCVHLTGMGDAGAEGFALYETQSEDCLYRYVCEEGQSAEIAFREIDGSILLFIAVSGGIDVRSVICVDLESGETISEIAVPEEADVREIYVSPDGDALAGLTGTGLVLLEEEDGTEDDPASGTDSAGAAAGETAGSGSADPADDAADKAADAALSGSGAAAVTVLFAADSADGEKVLSCVQPGGGELLVLTVEDASADGLRLLTWDFSSGSLRELDLQPESGEDFGIAAGLKTPRVCICSGSSLFIIDAEKGTLVQEIRIGELLPSGSGLAFSFFDGDQKLIVTCGKDLFLYNAETGSLLDSLEWESGDAALEAMSSYTLQLVTDSSDTYFALKDTAYIATSQISSGRQLLLIFSVDEEGELNPYAQVSHGYASFSGGEVCVRSSNCLSWTHLYSYGELLQQASSLLSG